MISPIPVLGHSSPTRFTCGFGVHIQSCFYSYSDRSVIARMRFIPDDLDICGDILPSDTSDMCCITLRRSWISASTSRQARPIVQSTIVYRQINTLVRRPTAVGADPGRRVTRVVECRRVWVPCWCRLRSSGQGGYVLYSTDRRQDGG